MIAVDGVATTCKIPVFALVLRIKVIKFTVRQPLEIDDWAIFPPFSSVIEHHIQNYSNPGTVKGLHHIAELIQASEVVRIYEIVGMRGKEAMGAITPVIPESTSSDTLRDVLFIKRHYGQESNVGDSKFLEIWDLFTNSRKGSWIFDP